MPNPVKVEMLSELKSKFEESRNFIVTDFRGLNVAQISDLREILGKNNATYKVVKNRVARLALSELGIEGSEEHFVGPTAVAFVGSDVPGVAKELVRLEKTTPMAIKAAYIDGEFFDPEGVVAISQMPSRDALLSMVAGGMMSVLSNFAGGMSNLVAQFGLCLQALEQKKGN